MRVLFRTLLKRNPFLLVRNEMGVIQLLNTAGSCNEERIVVGGWKRR
jgi:hypothetical protein